MYRSVYNVFMDEEHFFGKVAVKAMIVDGDRVLVTRSDGDEMWDFPGGRINANETLEDSIIREVQEEIGAEIHNEGMFCSVQAMHFKDNAYILFVIFKATLVDPSIPFTNPDREADETKWISRDEIGTLKVFPQCVKPLELLWGML
jgi:8-oxo-dGTP diphosphatase